MNLRKTLNNFGDKIVFFKKQIELSSFHKNIIHKTVIFLLSLFVIINYKFEFFDSVFNFFALLVIFIYNTNEFFNLFKHEKNRSR